MDFWSRLHSPTPAWQPTRQLLLIDDMFNKFRAVVLYIPPLIAATALIATQVRVIAARLYCGVFVVFTQAN